MIDSFVEERKLGIGGSDSSIILFGQNSWGKTIQDLYEEKIGNREGPKENNAMRRGKKLEPIAAAEYSELTGRKVRKNNRSLVHPEHPFLRGNIDREILKDKRGVGILELKCPNIATFRKYQNYGIPDDYQIQLQHYLLVGDYNWGEFALFNADLWEMIHFETEPDKTIHQEIIKRGEKFWECVENRTPPPEPEEDKRIKIPKAEGRILLMKSEEWIEAARAFKEATEISKDAQMVLDFSKEELKKLMGENEICEGSGLRIFYKEGKPGFSVDSKKLQEKHPDIYEEVKKAKKVSRSFRPFFTEK